MMKNGKGVEFTPILCVDFDGVINSYKSGGLARGGRSDYIPDPPVSGALNWLAEAMEDWDVQIYSGRSREAAGIEAMKGWLLKHATEEWKDAGRARKFVDALKFPTQKPYAFLMIDDRAICFQGRFDELAPKDLLNFKPWHKRGRK
jgi:hypothetical protein